MEYRLKVNGSMHTAEVESMEDGFYRVELGDKVYEMSCFRISDNQIHLNVNGIGTNVYLKGDTSKEIICGGREFLVQDADEIERSGTQGKFRDKPDSVTPPMPSIIVKVLVSENDSINEGDPVVVVSAMKLETTLSAPYSGIVKSVNTAEGDKVMPGDILVDIEKTVTGEGDDG